MIMATTRLRLENLKKPFAVSLTKGLWFMFDKLTTNGKVLILLFMSLS